MAADAHSRRIVVWDVPPAVECGETFRIKLGVKCESDCLPREWSVELHDETGSVLTTTRLSDEPWAGTAALYHAEVELTAPASEGMFTWDAVAPGVGQLESAAEAADESGEAACNSAHDEVSQRFNVRTVSAPECLLEIVAIDRERQTPVRGAKVVVHPYRALTNDNGIAEIRVPKGAYRVFVSGGDYYPFRHDAEVDADMTIRAELEVALAPSDAEIWP